MIDKRDDVREYRQAYRRLPSRSSRAWTPLLRSIILRMPCSFTGQLVGSSKGGRGWIDWTRTTGAMPSRRIKVHDRRGSSIATKRIATNRVLMTERSPITAGLRLKHGNFGSAHPPGMLVICHRFGHSVCLLADRLSCGVRDERGNRTSARRGWVCWRPEGTPDGPSSLHTPQGRGR